MRLDKLLTRHRVIDLHSRDPKAVLAEMVNALRQSDPKLNPERLLKALMAREHTLTTALGQGVAIPHARVPMKRRILCVVGRSAQGIIYDQSQPHPVNLVVMLVANPKEKSFLRVLNATADFAKDVDTVKRIVHAESPEEAFKIITRTWGPSTARVPTTHRALNRSLITHALALGRQHYVTSVFLFADALASLDEASRLCADYDVIAVTRNKPEQYRDDRRVKDVIQISSGSGDRVGQLKLAMLLALTRGLIRRDERIICIAGLPGSGLLDTLVLVDAAREYQMLFSPEEVPLPEDLRPEVLERVIGIAGSLAAEGREGKPVGTIFVVGDTDRVQKSCRPMVINPFYGYREDDRNILDPFMEETVKEFSSIDGAFVIRGDGVIMSAGSYLLPNIPGQELPSGYGARHEAAAGITATTDAIAIVISESTRQVSVFRKGAMITALDTKGQFKNSPPSR
jgi:DNA integrity scanning protein DisA with diadenylate cyclase activity/mannitol/fructose-specific phosphotransferase system IIA component (Ntr-type)